MFLQRVMIAQREIYLIFVSYSSNNIDSFLGSLRKSESLIRFMLPSEIAKCPVALMHECVNLEEEMMSLSCLFEAIRC